MTPVDFGVDGLQAAGRGEFGADRDGHLVLAEKSSKFTSIGTTFFNALNCCSSLISFSLRIMILVASIVLQSEFDTILIAEVIVLLIEKAKRLERFD